MGRIKKSLIMEKIRNDFMLWGNYLINPNFI